MLLLFLILAVSSVGWLYICCRALNRLAALSDRLISLTVGGGIFLLLTPFLFIYWLISFNRCASGLFFLDIQLIFNRHFLSFAIVIFGCLFFLIEIIRRKIRQKIRARSINNFSTSSFALGTSCQLPEHSPGLRQSTKNVDCPLIPKKNSFYKFVYKFASLVPGNKINKLLVHKFTFNKKIKIAHISDVHFVTRVSKEYYEKIVEIVNNEKPDIILLTGDYLQAVGTADKLKPIFSKLKAKAGIFFVCGNHDIWHDEKSTVNMLEQIGFIHIAGKTKEIHINNKTIFIAGTEQPWNKDDISAEIQKLPAGFFTILLSHSPDNIRKLHSDKISLVLSGHTHGGQNALPLLGPMILPSKYGTLYEAGLAVYKNSLLYVSRGIAVHHPFRLFCPLEIAFFEI